MKWYFLFFWNLVLAGLNFWTFSNNSEAFNFIVGLLASGAAVLSLVRIIVNENKF